MLFVYKFFFIETKSGIVNLKQKLIDIKCLSLSDVIETSKTVVDRRAFLCECVLGKTASCRDFYYNYCFKSFSLIMLISLLRSDTVSTFVMKKKAIDYRKQII